MKSFLRSTPARAALWMVPCLLLLFGIYWVHLLNHVGIDDWLERKFLQYASHSAQTTGDANLLLLTIDPKKTNGLGDFDDGIVANQKWRATHAVLLAKLTEAKAPVVAFDLSFAAPVKQFEKENKELADAIKAARASGTTLPLVGYVPDMAPNPAIDAVMPRDRMGAIDIPEHSYDVEGNQYLTRVLLAESTVDDSVAGQPEHVVWPVAMPLAIYLAHHERERGRPASLSIDPWRGALIIRWNSGPPTIIDAEINVCQRDDPSCKFPEGREHDSVLRRAVMPVWMGLNQPFSDDTYANVLQQDKLDPAYYGKRVVLVGALTQQESQTLGPEAPKTAVFGLHVHARVFADLEYNTYPRHASAFVQTLSFVLLILGGLAARMYMPAQTLKVPIPLAGELPLPVGFTITVAIYLFIAAMIFASRHIFFDLGYQILALVIGYYAIPKLAKFPSHVVEQAKVKKARPKRAKSKEANT